MFACRAEHYPAPERCKSAISAARPMVVGPNAGIDISVVGLGVIVSVIYHLHKTGGHIGKWHIDAMRKIGLI